MHLQLIQKYCRAQYQTLVINDFTFQIHYAKYVDGTLVLLVSKDLYDDTLQVAADHSVHSVYWTQQNDH